ncbi:unnamed protein product [Rotaria socialis]|uniref:G-protein coupled receptors family 1 profile domain-containing protein n=1 Tax=Rotaria socialis TaxID=392032 RepID=A0A818DLV5_9BILA|nr:unnamed protein product [Rotaria socialis]
MSSNYILTIKYVIDQITRFVPYITIIAGTSGGLCNLFTFTSRQLRDNACAFYLLFSAVFDLISILFGGVTRLMLDHYTNLLPIESSWFCKLRTYLAILPPGLATYFLTLSAVDRCLLTSRSANHRAWSRIKVARRTVVITTFIWLLSGIHLIICYDVQVINVNNNVFLCVPFENIYSIFVSIYFFVCFLLTPCVIMIGSSILTWTHIKTLQRRVGPEQFQRIANGRTDRHLITIMFVQKNTYVHNEYVSVASTIEELLYFWIQNIESIDFQINLNG